VPSGTLRRDWPPDDDGLRLIHNLEKRTGSMRGADRVIRMAWTLADLAGHKRPNREDVSAALCFRDDAQDLAS
jgi:magnesium chelatase family protein